LYHFPEFRNLLETAATFLRPVPPPDPKGKGFLLNQLLVMFQALNDTDTLSAIIAQFCDFLDDRPSFKRFANPQLTSDISISNSQNDAREFFEYILEEIRKEIDIPLDQINFAQNLENLMFYHTCNVFKNRSKDIPPYPIVSLAISLTTTNLIECIENFFKEKLDEEQKGYERLVESQSLFVFGLNRFSFSINTGRTTKIHFPVQIPEAITITKKAFHRKNIFVELQLYAVIVHRGQTPQSGHYYTYLKPDPYGHWYRFNDSQVTPVVVDFLKGEDVLKNAYIVFYKNVLSAA